MAYYCEVFDLTRPNVGTLMVHFNMHDDSAFEDDGVTHKIVQGPVTIGFNVTTYNPDGTVKQETGNQKKQRLADEFMAYSERLITDATLVDANFEGLHAEAVGFRYPRPV